jgi:hypothetical protein
MAAAALRNDARLRHNPTEVGDTNCPRFRPRGASCLRGRRNFLNDLGADVLALWPDFGDYEVETYCCVRSRFNCKERLAPATQVIENA